jgi:hypothetical protein
MHEPVKSETKKQKDIKVHTRDWKSQGEGIARKEVYCAKVPKSHAQQQSFNAAALHDDAPTSNQAN